MYPAVYRCLLYFISYFFLIFFQVLHFEGFIRDKVQDWWTEKNRIHFVKVLYYLENNTMKIIEPQVPNSGLYQVGRVTKQLSR